MDLNEMFNKLSDNPELAKTLEEAVGRNADAEELKAILLGADLDAEDVEALIVEYQRKLGEILAVDDVDEKALKRVAGGGSGINCTQADDCDHHFKQQIFWDRKRCDYKSTCDEFFCQPTV